MRMLSTAMCVMGMVGLGACVAPQPATFATAHPNTERPVKQVGDGVWEQGLMKTPRSSQSTQGIYMRQGLESASQYYWMQPHSMGVVQGAAPSQYALEARWHNQQKGIVRLFVYDDWGMRDVAGVRLVVDGIASDYMATWPAETIDDHHAKQATRQYVDVPYSVLESIRRAHDAHLILFFANQTQDPVSLVSQGQRSEAAAGLERLFSAIEAH